MTAWDGMISFILLVGLIQVIGAVALRFYVKTLPPVRLNRVAPRDAESIVTDYLDGFEETRLGFPTGFFTAGEFPPEGGVAFDERRSSSIGWKAIAGVILVPMTVGASVGGFIGSIFGSRDENYGPFGALVGGATGLAFGLYLAPLVLGATVLELVVKYLGTSRIEAHAQPASDDPLDSVVTFRLRGACALLSENVIMAGFRPPVLPPEYANVVRGLTPDPAIA
jgi:hypothetical protein